MNYLQTIASDHEVTVTELTPEELEIGLACSKRVRKHLANQVVNSSDYKYYRNLQVLEKIIQTYQVAINRHRLPLMPYNQSERLNLSA